ncbi:hypothetical protein [Haloarcula rara]|uniref:hypothetical protein n=1 Tax=Haloarcula rara TaxID=3033387 RepID=UPI0023E7A5AE|nr:hypothetical protein [Halomicroarcula sp. SHR3]
MVFTVRADRAERKYYTEYKRSLLHYPMQRRSILSRLGGGLTVTAVAGLAGCSGDGSEAGSGEAVESSVDGLTVISHEEGAPDGVTPPERSFVVSLIIENSGDSETDPTGYDEELRLFDESDTNITPKLTSVQPADIELAPGEQRQLAVSGVFEEDSEYAPDDVTRYELSLTCTQFSDGTYCE